MRSGLRNTGPVRDSTTSETCRWMWGRPGGRWNYNRRQVGCDGGWEVLVLQEELLTAEFAENGRGGHGEIRECRHRNLKPAASDLTTDDW